MTYSCFKSMYRWKIMPSSPINTMKKQRNPHLLKHRSIQAFSWTSHSLQMLILHHLVTQWSPSVLRRHPVKLTMLNKLHTLVATTLYSLESELYCVSKHRKHWTLLNCTHLYYPIVASILIRIWSSWTCVKLLQPPCTPLPCWGIQLTLC